MARMEVIGRLRSEGQEIPRSSLKALLTKANYTLLNNLNHQPEITTRKFDLIEMVDIVFEPWVTKIIFTALAIQITFACVSYCSIFAASFASVVPLGFYDTCNIYKGDGFFNECRVLYWVWLLIYYLFMLYFVIKGLSEQAWMQAVMSIMRFVVVFLMVGTAIGDIAGHNENTGSDSRDTHLP